MVEVVVATLLTGVVVVGALNVMGGAIKTRHSTLVHLDGPMLANELLAEVLGKPYEDPDTPGGSIGLDSGEVSTRSTFDDVDDYDNWVETPPIDTTDTAIAGYTGWTREVQVTYRRRDTAGSWFSETGLRQIHVQVTAPDGTVTDRYGYRWKEGAIERDPPVDTEVVTWVGAELQIGALGLARASASLLNTPEN